MNTIAGLYTFIYLQGSQTQSIIRGGDDLLYTFIYLQGSQTIHSHVRSTWKLYTFIYLQGSQTLTLRRTCHLSFTPLFTYKVLKLSLNLFQITVALHLYLLTRFSNQNQKESN